MAENEALDVVKLCPFMKKKEATYYYDPMDRPTKTEECESFKACLKDRCEAWKKNLGPHVPGPGCLRLWGGK